MTTLDTSNEKDSFLKLKSTSSSIAYDGLLHIRSNIIKSKEGYKILKENGVLKDLVNFLNKPNEKILDVTLSILANCCLESDCRNEVVDLGTVGPLASILNNVAKDSIQCRTCRLIGNLAQEVSIAEKLLNEDVLVPIVALLDTECNSTISAKQMAVRALRMLWNVEKDREKMIDVQVVRAVALLLSINPEKAGEQELLQEVVKALVIFTNNHSEECAQQVQGNGSGFQHLVSLVANRRLKYSALACICNLCRASSSRPALGSVGTVKIIIKELSFLQPDTGPYTDLVLALCYLCHESVNRAKIRRAGGLPLILKIIRNSSKEPFQSSVLHCLVQFVYDEVSLQELLQEGLLTILVNKVADYVKQYGKVHSKSHARPQPGKIAGQTTSFSDNGNTIADRNKCSPVSRYRAESLSEGNRQQNTPRRRFRANSPSYQEVVKEQCNSSRYLSGSNHQDFSDQYREISPDTSPRGQISPDYCSTIDWSPLSPSSMCCSPESSPPQHRLWTSSLSSDGLSPPISPPNLYTSIVDDSDCPEIYSPICYDPGEDDDDDDDHDVNDIEEIDDEDFMSQDIREDKSRMSVDSGCDSLSSDFKHSMTDSKKFNDSDLDTSLFMLSRISYMDYPVEGLAANSTITALLDYITLIKDSQPRASRTLFRIIRNHHYFMPLLLQRFVFIVHSHLCQSSHFNCWICSDFKLLGQSLFSQMTMFAQSGFGEGEIAHFLLKAEESVQKLLAVSVPYIVRLQKKLFKFMIECGALKILVQMLENSNSGFDDLAKYVPESLKLLAAAIDVPNPYLRSEGVCFRDVSDMDHLDGENAENIIPGTTKASEDTVFLLLDDGSSVQVSKTCLSSQSPMFEAMFRGNFKESTEDYVSLPGISHDCLLNLLHVMKSGFVSSSIQNINLSASLELVAVLDRFLIPGSERVTEMIVSQFLSSDTVYDIYSRCVAAGDVSHFHSLRYDTVRFILTSSTSNEKTEKMFNDLLQSKYKKQVVNDISDILQEKLNQIRKKPSNTSHTCHFFISK